MLINVVLIKINIMIQKKLLKFTSNMTDTSLRRHLSHNVEGRCLPYKKTSIRRINLNTDTSMDGHFYMSGRGIFIENLLFKTINYSKP